MGSSTGPVTVRAELQKRIAWALARSTAVRGIDYRAPRNARPDSPGEAARALSSIRALCESAGLDAAVADIYSIARLSGLSLSVTLIDGTPAYPLRAVVAYCRAFVDHAPTRRVIKQLGEDVTRALRGVARSEARAA